MDGANFLNEGMDMGPFGLDPKFKLAYEWELGFWKFEMIGYCSISALVWSIPIIYGPFQLSLYSLRQ
jgi:hypothetical protein